MIPSPDRVGEQKDKPIAVIRTSMFARELLEQAYREIEQNKSKKGSNAS